MDTLEVLIKMVTVIKENYKMARLLELFEINLELCKLLENKIFIFV